MKDDMTRDRQPGQPEDPDGKLINMGNGIPPMSEDEIDKWSKGIFDRLKQSSDSE